jgi:hypothetical protein
MRKRTGLGLVLAGLIVGVFAASIFVSAVPAPAAEPTRLPVPTFTPTPGGIQGEYAELATQYQKDLADAMSQVGQLLATPQLADAAWNAQVAEAMTSVESAYAQLSRLEPTDGWRDFHGEMMAGAADCSAAMRVLDFALDEQDRSAVGVVSGLLTSCQSHLVAAQQLVADMGSSVELPQ